MLSPTLALRCPHCQHALALSDLGAAEVCPACSAPHGIPAPVVAALAAYEQTTQHALSELLRGLSGAIPPQISAAPASALQDSPDAPEAAAPAGPAPAAPAPAATQRRALAAATTTDGREPASTAPDPADRRSASTHGQDVRALASPSPAPADSLAAPPRTTDAHAPLASPMPVPADSLAAPRTTAAGSQPVSLAPAPEGSLAAPPRTTDADPALASPVPADSHAAPPRTTAADPSGAPDGPALVAAPGASDSPAATRGEPPADDDLAVAIARAGELAPPHAGDPIVADLDAPPSALAAPLDRAVPADIHEELVAADLVELTGRPPPLPADAAPLATPPRLADMAPAAAPREGRIPAAALAVARRALLARHGEERRQRIVRAGGLGLWLALVAVVALFAAGLWYAAVPLALLALWIRLRREERDERFGAEIQRLAATWHGQRLVAWDDVDGWFDAFWPGPVAPESAWTGPLHQAVRCEIDGYHALVDIHLDERTEGGVVYPPRVVTYLAAAWPGRVPSLRPTATDLPPAAAERLVHLRKHGYIVAADPHAGLSVRVTDATAREAREDMARLPALPIPLAELAALARELGAEPVGPLTPLR